MRLSIWYQFSSNHSAFFSIVGQFETNEAAQNAYHVWLHLITEIIAWRKEHPDQDDEVRTPIELEYDLHYGVQLDYGDEYAIGWCGDDPMKVVSQHDNLVIVCAPEETLNNWDGPLDLMQALGAETGLDVVEGSETILTTTCTAPDDATAQRIYDEIVGGMKEVPGKNFDYARGRYVDAVHISLEVPEALKGIYQQFEIKRTGRFFTFVGSDEKLWAYLRSQGFTHLHHKVREIAYRGAGE